MLDEADVIDAVRVLWSQHRDELLEHDRVYNYVRGKYGVPDVPEGATQELKDIARESVKNVLRMVRDAFAEPLRVTGIRAAGSDDNDAAAWGLWQAQKLDARQAEAHRAAVTYGTSYAFIETGGIRLRTPRQAFAVYADPHVDDWPVFALETWMDFTDPKRPLRRGRLVDDEAYYPVTLGAVSRMQLESERSNSTSRRLRPELDGDPIPHGLDHAPVARFINVRDAEDLVEGEVAPLIPEQRAINAVNFDRLVVSRYGAFPQKYVTGWLPESSNALVQASVQRLMAFQDSDVKPGAFPSAQVEPYNSILAEMVVDVAMKAKLPPFGISGNYANLAADALAVIRAPYEAKLSDKRTSFGETWEQALRDYGALNGVLLSDDVEVVWETGEARSYAQVVDGISKLAAAGVPIDTLLDDVPGWTQQRVDAAKGGVRRAQSRAALQLLRGGAQPPEPPAA